MSRRNPGKCVLLGLLAVACLDCSIPSAANAGDLETPQGLRSHAATRPQAVIEDRADVVGTITVHRTGAVVQAEATENARAAQARFRELRVAMEREMSLRQVVSKDEIAALESNMKELSAHLNVLVQSHELKSLNKARNAWDPAQDWYQACSKVINDLRAAMESEMSRHEPLSKDEIAAREGNMRQLSAQLTALIQSHNFQSSNKARNALELARDWYEASLKVINPPAEGVTELPLPMSLSEKADLVAVALDEMLAEAQTYASAPRPIGLPQRRAISLKSVTSNTNPVPSYAFRQSVN